MLSNFPGHFVEVQTSSDITGTSELLEVILERAEMENAPKEYRVIQYLIFEIFFWNIVRIKN